MQKTVINLHYKKKRRVTLICIIILLFIVLYISFAVITRKYYEQMSSLLKSNYKYSAYMINSENKDDYLVYDSGIGFGAKKEYNYLLNTDVVMQTKESDYTENINWNTKKLKTDEIAISKGIAERYNLKLGEKLYSKHLVTDKIQEYTIRVFLPDMSSIRIASNNDYKDGVIIMGYDSTYQENINHRFLVFTNIPVKDLTTSSVEVPDEIIYRDDEMKYVLVDALPYIIVFIVLKIIIMVIYVIILYQLITKNVKRYIVIGYTRNNINKAILKYLRGSIVPIFFSSIFYSGIMIVNKICDIEITFILVTILIEIIVTIILIKCFDHKLWGKL